MAENIEHAPVFDARADVTVAASPDQVYGVISDMPRSGEWSCECQGGAWIEGEPATVGAVFRGENLRSESVVAWAPVVRGTWYTTAEVVAAEPGRTFRWAMRTENGERQQSVWGFDVAPAGSDGECVLTHHFRMDALTEGMRGIVADMDEVERRRFYTEWGEKVRVDMEATVARIKDVIEQN